MEQTARVRVRNNKDLLEAVLRERPFKLDRNGCNITELRMPMMIQSKLLKQVFQKSESKIDKIYFDSSLGACKARRIERLMNYLANNNTVTQIILVNSSKQDDYWTTVKPFFSTMENIIKALNNIKVIKLSKFNNFPIVQQFLQSIKQTDICLELDQCQLSFDTLFENNNITKYAGIIKLNSVEVFRPVDQKEEALIEVLKKVTIKEICLTDFNFEYKQWMSFLKITTVENIHLYDCRIDVNSWRHGLDLLAKNKFIKTLEPKTDEYYTYLNMTHYSDLLRKNTSLKRFGKLRGKETPESFAALAEAMKINTTLTYLNVSKVNKDFGSFTEILKHNKTLKTLIVDIDYIPKEFDSFLKFMNELKINTTLTAFYYGYSRRDIDNYKVLDVHTLKAFIDVLTVNKTLVRLPEELEANKDIKKLLDRNRMPRWNSIWFVHMIKKNAHLLDLLPLEVWLNVVSQFGVSGLDKILME